MDAGSKVQESIDKATTWLNEQEWFQEIRSKWDELDPQSQLYIRIGSASLGGILGIAIVFSALSAVTASKREYESKAELIALIKQAQSEIGDLKGKKLGAADAATKVNWRNTLQGIAGKVGVSGQFKVVNEKKGKTTDFATETLFMIAIEKVSIRQVVQMVFDIEHSIQPMRVRNLEILTKDDEGYLDAKIALSAFQVKG